MNERLREVLKITIQACVDGANEVQGCVYASNPKWMEVLDTLDQCTDQLREIEVVVSE